MRSLDEAVAWQARGKQEARDTRCFHKFSAFKLSTSGGPTAPVAGYE